MTPQPANRLAKRRPLSQRRRCSPNKPTTLTPSLSTPIPAKRRVWPRPPRLLANRHSLANCPAAWTCLAKPTPSSCRLTLGGFCPQFRRSSAASTPANSASPACSASTAGCHPSRHPSQSPNASCRTPTWPAGCSAAHRKKSGRCNRPPIRTTSSFTSASPTTVWR